MLNVKASIRLLLITAALVATSASALADTVTFSGTTIGAPTFNRPVDTGTALSVVGTAVRYSVFQFSVESAGSYTVLSTSTTAGYDPFLLLYRTTFNPAAPLTNFVFGDDDLAGDLTRSGFTLPLTTGFNYFLVQTGFDNNDFGNFTSVVSGPGTVVPVPEPATLLLFGAGIFGVAAFARKRRSAHQNRIEA